MHSVQSGTGRVHPSVAFIAAANNVREDRNPLKAAEELNAPTMQSLFLSMDLEQLLNCNRKRRLKWTLAVFSFQYVLNSAEIYSRTGAFNDIIWKI